MVHEHVLDGELAISHSVGSDLLGGLDELVIYIGFDGTGPGNVGTMVGVMEEDVSSESILDHSGIGLSKGLDFSIGEHLGLEFIKVIESHLGRILQDVTGDSLFTGGLGVTTFVPEEG